MVPQAFGCIPHVPTFEDAGVAKRSMTCCGSYGSLGSSQIKWGQEGFKIRQDDTFIVTATSGFAGWKTGYGSGCECGGSCGKCGASRRSGERGGECGCSGKSGGGGGCSAGGGEQNGNRTPKHSEAVHSEGWFGSSSTDALGDTLGTAHPGWELAGGHHDPSWNPDGTLTGVGDATMLPEDCCCVPSLGRVLCGVKTAGGRLWRSSHRYSTDTGTFYCGPDSACGPDVPIPRCPPGGCMISGAFVAGYVKRYAGHNGILVCEDPECTNCRLCDDYDLRRPLPPEDCPPYCVEAARRCNECCARAREYLEETEGTVPWRELADTYNSIRNSCIGGSNLAGDDLPSCRIAESCNRSHSVCPGADCASYLPAPPPPPPPDPTDCSRSECLTAVGAAAALCLGSCYGTCLPALSLGPLGPGAYGACVNVCLGVCAVSAAAATLVCMSCRRP